jgi:RecJ-like exonuclease
MDDPCRECDGTGFVGSTDMDCPDCDGLGFHIAGDDDDDDLARGRALAERDMAAIEDENGE